MSAKIPTILLTIALSCLCLVYLIGSAFSFDGQAAILTLPFVVGFWVCLAAGFLMGTIAIIEGMRNKNEKLGPLMAVMALNLLSLLALFFLSQPGR